METKKNEKANLERDKSSFFLLGIVIALGFALISFEWSAGDAGPDRQRTIIDDGGEIELLPPQTIENQPEPPKVVSPEIFEIIENNRDVPDIQIILDDPGGLDIPLQQYIIAIPADTVKEPEEFRIVEEMPRFRGGDLNRFSQWVNERIRYPQLAQENGIQGMVIVDFAVGADGTVTDLKLIRSVEKTLDEEVIRVVTNSPKWTPGKQRGVPVKVRFTLPVQFRLN